MPQRRRFSRWIWVALPAAGLFALILLWNWDWFVPLINREASASAGRPVTIEHLHMHLGRVTRVEVDGLLVGSPKGFDAPLAKIDAVKVSADIWQYVRHGAIVLPTIQIDRPTINALAQSDGKNNYTFPGDSGASKAPSKPVPAPEIGALDIHDGRVTVDQPHYKTKATVKIYTQAATGLIARHHQAGEIVVEGGGTYRGQPISIDYRGGALLSLREKGTVYPLDLSLKNGATHVSVAGTVQDPMAFKGANVTLALAGDSMADLLPLTGIPIPQTPPYKISGDLDYRAGLIRFENFQGRVGHSDLEGTITEDAGGPRPDVTMDLASKNVDLADLGGFIGAKPGDNAGKTPEDKKAAAQGKGTLLPSKPFNMPVIKAADIHLDYHADHIEGRSMPFDTLSAKLAVVDGDIHVHPVIFGVGKGRIVGNIDLLPQTDKRIHAKLAVDFQHVDLARMMQSTHSFAGAGYIGGKARLDSTGNSVATWVGDGNGGLALYMAGGDLSSLLVDLSGLEFGNAVISALGLPSKTKVSCFIGDFGLRNGQVNTNALLLDTGSAVIEGKGDIDLKKQSIDYKLRTDPKHFTVGSLPAPIDITGKLNSPSVHPDYLTLAARGGAAAALGFLAGPLAILPTVQLGTGETHECAGLLDRTRAEIRRDAPGHIPPTVLQPAK